MLRSGTGVPLRRAWLVLRGRDISELAMEGVPFVVLTGPKLKYLPAWCHEETR